MTSIVFLHKIKESNQLMPGLLEILHNQTTWLKTDKTYKEKY